MNFCATCEEDFGSVAAFDAHRVGKYLEKGRSEYTGSIEDWTPSKGRRCLSIPELEERGFVLNQRGRWSFISGMDVGSRLNSDSHSRVGV